jgi:hypothetical protein
MKYRTHLSTIPSRLLFLTLSLLIAAAAAPAQDVDDVVRTETSLVQLNVGVVDKQGRSLLRRLVPRLLRDKRRPIWPAHQVRRGWGASAN